VTAPDTGPDKTREAMGLHAAIMNLPCKFEAAWQTPAPSDWIEGYVNGHRDTRHAAAELAASHEGEVKRLREALTEVKHVLDEAQGYVGTPAWSPSMAQECAAAVKLARAALQGDKQ
jgi:phytoene dehydrogenase-like protein